MNEQPRMFFPAGNDSVPRDDLAFASVDSHRAEQIAGTPPEREARASSADRMAPPPARSRIAPVVGKLWKREDLAPGFTRRGTFIGVLGHQKRNGERRIAVKQHERLALGRVAHGDADEFADAYVDCHFHAAHGAVQRHALAMKFDLPDAAVGAAVARGETDRQ